MRSVHCIHAPAPAADRDGGRRVPLWWPPMLAAAAVLVQGFHPMAEDGGLYLAGVELRLDPTLFPHDRAFVLPHLAYSVFAPLLAAVVRGTHASLAAVVLAAFVLTRVMLAYAVTRLSLDMLVSRRVAMVAAVVLMVSVTVPVAGTSLLLDDPYLTARSFSLPLSIAAVAAMLRWVQGRRRAWVVAVGLLVVAAVFHPLMAGYAAAFAGAVVVVGLPGRVRGVVAAGALAGICAACGWVQMRAGAEPAAVVAAVYSRYYWFLSQWQWFEWVGLAAPMGLLAWLLRRRAGVFRGVAALEAALLVGGGAPLAAMCFAERHFAAHVIARLQPLRAFQMVYVVFLLALCGGVGEGLRRWPRAQWWVAVMTPCVLAAVFFFVQRQGFPLSRHVELPGAVSANPWVQAFVWVRENTAADALVALDATYVNTEGEDAQVFRAIALRSAVPDYSKDGGEAAITPRLAAMWLPAAQAQMHLSAQEDATRDRGLAAFGATWMIVDAHAATVHACPYANAVVKVCRLGGPATP